MAERIVLRGTVQGVGLRPAIARVAKRRGLAGYVRNDAGGVTIVLPDRAAADTLLADLHAELPPLARILDVQREAEAQCEVGPGFAILASEAGEVTTEVAADAAPCAACVAEVFGPLERRYRYPFTNCTQCGPRFSIVTSVPYDRAATTMAAFAMCDACRREYEDCDDRRYHAQPIACHACGPRVRLSRCDGRAFSFERYSALDEVDAIGGLLRDGQIVALKGVGGYQLLADATREDVVAKLRQRKARESKPFALMVRDLAVLHRFALPTAHELAALQSPAAPIVLLARGGEAVAPSVAPGVATLGFMLPSSPLHHLLLRRVDRPIVCTSGNRSDEPPCSDDQDAHRRLAGIADWLVSHDRRIHNRVDDSVAREIDGKVRLLRRARGYAPDPIALPPGFAQAPAVLALGGQLKSTVALSGAGRAVLSPHLGDLDDVLTAQAWRDSITLLERLYGHRPRAIAVDLHPEYRATRAGHELAAERAIEVIGVQHHHAHIAACLAEHGYPLDGPPVLGIALDGLGYGSDGTLWGGEFLRTSYASAERVGMLKPVAMLGGDAASREPWRNLYAQLMAEIGWAELTMNFDGVACLQRLGEKNRALLDRALGDRQLAPLASSAGRLFDAVAAALELHFDRVDHEGQAAAALEALVTQDALVAASAEERYPIGIPRHRDTGLPYLEPAWLWRAVLGDLHAGESKARIAARFHVGLADALVRMAKKLSPADAPYHTVVLSGGVWQNRVLTELTAVGLRDAGFSVLLHERVPPNDGGLSLGQIVVAAARLVARQGT